MVHITMIKLTDQQINEIAENLDGGMRCFYNKQSGEIKTLLDFDNWDGADEELWEEEIMEIDEHWVDLVELEKMSSRESFQLMVDFVETIDNPGLQDRLFIALNRSKPFRNFKWQIDNSGKYRPRWFKYKDQRYIELVKKQLDDYNRIEYIE